MTRILKKSLFTAIVLMGFSFCVGQLNYFQMTSNSTSESYIDADSYNGVGGVVYTRSGGIYYRYGLGAEEFVGTGEKAKLAIDSAGNPHVVFLSGGSMYYNRYDGDWNNEIQMQSATGISEVDIDTDSGNNAHFIFRGRYYDDSAYRTASDDVVYITYSGGSFNYIKGWNGYYEYLGGADGYGYYYTAYPVNIHIDSGDNYHLTYWSRSYNKWMGGTDNTYYVNHDSNIGGANSSFLGNVPLYENGLTSIGTSAYGLYTSPFKVASLNGIWSDNSAWVSGTPELASDGTNLGVAFIEGTDLKYSIASGATFGGGSIVATGATELAFTMNDGKFFIYYIKSDGVDNEIYLLTDAVLDTTPPTISIISPATNSYVNGSAIISFTGTELDSPDCSFDSSNWTGCTSGVTRLVDIPNFENLSDGNYQLIITETDLAGNTGYATGTFRRDTTSPTELVSGSSLADSFYAILSGAVFTDISFDTSTGFVYYGTGGDHGALHSQSYTGISFSPTNINDAQFLYWGVNPLTIDGLMANTHYNYFYKVFDTAGNALLSSIHNFTTLPDPVQEQFIIISNALTASGINNNLSDVNSFNYDNFSGLYFEKPDYGKITFNTGLDLSDTDTQNFLASLDQYLDMDLGYVDFTLSGTELANYGATILMYLENQVFPETPLSSDQLIVRDDLGIALDANSIVSGLHCYNVDNGNIQQICEFNTSHFTTFDLKPVLIYVSVYTNNSNNNRLGKVGDNLYLQFAGSEPLGEIDVNIGGKLYSLSEVSLTGGISTWTATLELTQDLTGGVVPFEIIYEDLYGNNGTPVTETTNSTNVTFDKIAPTASIEYTITTPTNQSVYAILTGCSESSSIINNGGNDTYLFTENGTFTFQFQDSAGNIGTSTATVDWIDKTNPTAVIQYNPDVSTFENVTAILTGYSENITITNNGGSNSYLFTGNGSFTFEFVDDVGNDGSETATVDWIDRTPPTANVAYSLTGLTNQDVIASLTGMSENITMTNNGGSFTYTFTANGAFTFEFEDAAGNTGSANALVDYIDKDAPTAPFMSNGNALIGYDDLTIYGTGSEGYQINIYINDTLIDEVLLDSPGITYNSGTKEFQIIIPNLQINEGENDLYISESDEAGNESAATDAITITKDITDPTVTNDYITDITKDSAKVYFDFEDENMTDGNWTGYVGIIESGVFTNINLGDIRRFDYEFPIYLDLNTGKGYSLFYGLDPKTTYNYTIVVSDDLENYGSNNGYFETASNIVPLDNTTYQGITTFTGTVNEGEDFNLSGYNLILESNANNFQHGLSGSLVLSGIQSFNVSGSNWDGILIPPTSVLSGYEQFGHIDELDLDSTFGSGTSNNSNVNGTFQAGAGSGTSLLANGGLFQIQIYVQDGNPGDRFYIFRSENGQNWELNTPDNSCELDANNICSYYTDHLSYFTTVNINDTTPNTFSFASVTNADINTEYQSEVVTIQGINTSTNFTVTNGLASINGGAWVSTGTVNNNDTIKLKNTSSSNYSTSVTTSIQIGQSTGNFVITTKTYTAPSGSSTTGGGGGVWSFTPKQTVVYGSGGSKQDYNEYNPVDFVKYINEKYFGNELHKEISLKLFEYVKLELDYAILIGFLNNKKYYYFNEMNAEFQKLVDAIADYSNGKISNKSFKNKVRAFAKYYQKFETVKNQVLVRKTVMHGTKAMKLRTARNMKLNTMDNVEKLIDTLINKYKKSDKTTADKISKIVLAYIISMEGDKTVGKQLLERFMK